MSGFNGINQFGSLTLQNGQRLSFKDIKDVDGDGKMVQLDSLLLIKTVMAKLQNKNSQCWNKNNKCKKL